MNSPSLPLFDEPQTASLPASVLAIKFVRKPTKEKTTMYTIVVTQTSKPTEKLALGEENILPIGEPIKRLECSVDTLDIGALTVFLHKKPRAPRKSSK